jgi:alanyl-tRNA synthetase
MCWRRRAQSRSPVTRAIVLDQTAFYPEAGGQLGDRGVLGGAQVHDTQETDDGAIIHVITGDAPAIGAGRSL